MRCASRGGPCGRSRGASCVWALRAPQVGLLAPRAGATSLWVRAVVRAGAAWHVIVLHAGRVRACCRPQAPPFSCRLAWECRPAISPISLNALALLRHALRLSYPSLREGKASQCVRLLDLTFRKSESPLLNPSPCVWHRWWRQMTASPKNFAKAASAKLPERLLPCALELLPRIHMC